MACFLIPAAEAVVVTATYAVVKHKEKKLEAPKLENGAKIESDTNKVAWSKKLSWLLAMLWGGVLLLAFEHFWHGEVVPFPPFLTAMATPESTAEMLHEMLTVGVSMAVTVTVVWGAICAFVDLKVKKAQAALKLAKEQ